jgi:hypothetical protein
MDESILLKRISRLEEIVQNQYDLLGHLNTVMPPLATPTVGHQ